MDLVLDQGDELVMGALFDEEQLIEVFALKDEELTGKLSEFSYQYKLVCKQGEALSAPFSNETEIALEGHRVANGYGALKRFPQNDCIIIDLGKEIDFSYVTAVGSFVGGAYLEDVIWKETPAAMGITDSQANDFGQYFGLLGAIERISAEMRLHSSAPSNVKVLVTGERLHVGVEKSFLENLRDFTDLIDPALNLVGLHEILKENRENYHV